VKAKPSITNPQKKGKNYVEINTQTGGRSSALRRMLLQL
jgi:hypothetical protein